MVVERKFKGVWIPAEMWLDRSLSITEKVMLVEIDSLDSPARGCYASNGHFSVFFALSTSRVSEIISGLAKKGLISIEFIRDGNYVVERRIRMVTPFGKPKTPSENTENPFGKGDEPPSEKAKGNNTKGSNTVEGKKPLIDKSIDAAFERFWKAGMRKVGKKAALRAYIHAQTSWNGSGDDFINSMLRRL